MLKHARRASIGSTVVSALFGRSTSVSPTGTAKRDLAKVSPISSNDTLVSAMVSDDDIIRNLSGRGLPGMLDEGEATSRPRASSTASVAGAGDETGRSYASYSSVRSAASSGLRVVPLSNR